MNHLLIWENIPDNTMYYILEPGKHDELIKLAAEAHGYYVNGEDNNAINELNEKLEATEKAETIHTDLCSKTPIPHGPFAAVYVCGCLL